MNKEDVRQKMLDIVGDIYHAKFVEHGLNGYTKFDGHTLDEANDTINKAFDNLTIDHPKVKLPREVGEELDVWQKNNPGATFGHYMDCVTYEADGLDDTYAWYQGDKLAILADAYRYGWDAEPEELFLVQTPKEWWEDSTVPEYFRLNSDGISSGYHYADFATQFTRAELKKYHFDSDIFTLVPVENEEVSQ